MTKLFTLGVVLFWLTAIIGWVMNLVQVITIGLAGSAVTALFILKLAGVVVAPLGAVLGWI